MKKSITLVTLVLTVFAIQETLFSETPNSNANQNKSSTIQNVIPAEAEARLRAIFERREFHAKSVRAAWLGDGSGYTVMEPVPGGDENALVLYDAAGGKRTVLASPSQFVTAGAAGPVEIERYTESPDGGWLLLETSSIGAENDVSEFWKLERSSGTLQKVAAGRSNSISPDGGRILYSGQGNLYINDLHSGRTVTLTKNAVEGSISNGNAVWSPDGRRIAFVERDQSRVPFRSILIPVDPSYPEPGQVRFARVGETIARLRVGVVDARGSEIRWLSIPEPAEGFYLGEVSWAGNSNELLVEKRSRFRDKREFLLADVRTGTITRIYHESDPAWVVASYRRNAGLIWIRGGSAFIVLSEKDGWRHAYIVSRNGKEESLLTPGPFDIMERGIVDKAEDWFYYFASPDNATQRYLYRASSGL